MRQLGEDMWGGIQEEETPEERHLRRNRREDYGKTWVTWELGIA